MIYFNEKTLIKKRYKYFHKFSKKKTKQVFTRFGAKCGKMLLLISVCFSLQTAPHSTPCRVFVDVNILFGWWSKILFFSFQNITCAFIALVIHIYWEILNFYFSQDMLGCPSFVLGGWCLNIKVFQIYLFPLRGMRVLETLLQLLLVSFEFGPCPLL